METSEGRVVCCDRRARIHPERPVLYPELIYRRYCGDQLVEEALLRIAMRYYYPEELEVTDADGYVLAFARVRDESA